MATKKIKKVSKKKHFKKIKLEGQPNWWTNTALISKLLFLLGVALYLNTLGHDFAQDDTIVITDNMYTTQGVSGIPGILTKDTFFGFFKDPSKANLVAGGRYRPLSLVFFAVEYELFGETPFVGHLINALLYGFTGWLLYFLVLQLFASKENKLTAHWLAIVATLLFLVHPIHTEVVANIKGRDEILALLFSMGGLLVSHKAFKSNSIILSVVAGILFFLGMLSKENAATFIFIVPLSFYFFTKASGKKIALQSIPVFGAFILFFIIRQSILSDSLGAPLSRELMNNPFLKWNGSTYVDMGFGEKMAIVFYTLGKYLQLSFFPYPLTHDYYPKQIPSLDWANPLVLLSFVLYAALGIYALLRSPKKDPISFCIWYYLLTLFIVSNILFPIGTNMSERFLYMPSVGTSLAIAILMQRLMERSPVLKFKQVVPYLVGVGVVGILLSGLTIWRNQAWKDNFTLFTTDIQTSFNSAKLRNAVGGELLTQSQKPESQNEKEGMINEAIGHLNEAIQLHPAYKNAYLLLGNAYSYLSQFDNALQYYNQALALDPLYRDAILNQAITYMNLKQPEKALNNIQTLIQNYPDDPQYSSYLAMAYRDMGRQYGEVRGDLQNALTYLHKSLEIDPNDYETLRLMGVAYGIQNQSDKALEYFKKALEQKPQDPDALYNLGTAYYNLGDVNQGASYHQKAIQIDPGVTQRMGRGK